MENESMKTITILLTKYSDLFGKFICGISKNRYSHASISIDESEEIFYSFNVKGFVIEKPKKRLRIFGKEKSSMHTQVWEWYFVYCIFLINSKIGIFVPSLLLKSWRKQELSN